MLNKVDYYEQQSQQLLGYALPQVWLLHANALNAVAWPNWWPRMRRRGYRTVTLDEALADPAYARADGYNGRCGPSWMHRWAMAEQQPKAFYAGEPQVPPWVLTWPGWSRNDPSQPEPDDAPSTHAGAVVVRIAARLRDTAVAAAGTGHGHASLVVRHAEKADDGSRDPPLDAVGMARAQRLATALHAEPVVAVYATGYRRTQQTAAATAADHALAVTAYAADQAASAFAAQLRSQHPSGTVVVVGHSNTAPGIAAALCDCTATPLGDTDYGRVYRIRVDADGHRVLPRNPPCRDPLTSRA